MKPLTLTLAICLGAPALAEAPLVLAVASSARPVSRPAMTTPVTADIEARFQLWLTEFRTQALAQGVSAKTLDAALPGLTYDAEVVRRDRNQAEFTKTVWDYLDTAVSSARIDAGIKAVARHAALFDRIEAQWGVDRHVIAAIWGLESAYGLVRGNDSTLKSLASLAFDTRRPEFFGEQFLTALQILDAGEVRLADMRGSWAGAMGHTQFMPTSYRDHAVDFDGDGRRNIWSDNPADALASTAAYLKANGWVTGQPWGVEVTLPQGFDLATARRELTRMPSEWAALGIRDTDGKPVPDHGPASILLPGGGTGPIFMIFDNFAVLETYNTADAYVIGVGHLGDRIAGRGPIRGDWPRQDRALTFDERIELQERLTVAGFDTQKIDAKIGPLTINAVRDYQLSLGIMPDGYASLRVLERLRQAQ
ncbi:lytic murein transglycosylase [Ruegeria sp. WL0004]|uniref:Lytic murein transglycosylase n=1 Tax=Ruegeria marisflavi TaxID=2984152 RepID=A0ABT2WJS9_9RHOB|nr:lytic murein transglycosylase [Ruegeria sp. WL0004]MCU9836150.1 lytic murein transglycosylase [Ruegeria sp. WL0004]